MPRGPQRAVSRPRGQKTPSHCLRGSDVAQAGLGAAAMPLPLPLRRCRCGWAWGDLPSRPRVRVAYATVHALRRCSVAAFVTVRRA
jgi:hypothetical protein